MDTIDMDSHGWLKNFVIAHVDPSAASPSAEADRLMPILESRGGKTTRNSLMMAVRHYAPDARKRRRRANGGANGASATPPNGHAAAGRVEVLYNDDALARLAAARELLTTFAAEVIKLADAVAQIEAETVERRARLAQIRELL
jgi:hypothetical protein